MAEVCKRAHDAVVAPASVLARQADHQRLYFRRDARPARIATLSGAVELLRNQSPIPSQNGIRLCYGGDVLQSFASDSLCNFGEGASLWIRQLEPSGQMCPQDFVFRDQIL